MPKKHVGLADYGLRVESTATQTFLHRARGHDMVADLPDEQVRTVGTYFPDYGYFRFGPNLQDAIHNLYRNIGRRYLHQDWLWSEAKTLKHLQRLRHLYRMDQQDPKIFMRALTYHADENHHRELNGDCTFTRPFGACLALAQANLTRLDVLAELWGSGLPVDMLIMAGQGQYVGLMRDLA